MQPTSRTRARRRAAGWERGAFTCILLALGAWCRPASAQFSVDRWAVADGGGLSTSGNYLSIEGTIGQSDAWVTAGGAWTLNGGFWSGWAIDPASVSGPAKLPTRFAFYPCAPNPISGHTRIAVDLPHQGPVRIEVFSVAGARLGTVLDRPVNAGHLVVDWDATGANGRRLPSGAYLITAHVAGKRFSQHVVVLN